MSLLLSQSGRGMRRFPLRMRTVFLQKFMQVRESVSSSSCNQTNLVLFLTLIKKGNIRHKKKSLTLKDQDNDNSYVYDSTTRKALFMGEALSSRNFSRHVYYCSPFFSESFSYG